MNAESEIEEELLGDEKEEELIENEKEKKIVESEKRGDLLEIDEVVIHSYPKAIFFE